MIVMKRLLFYLFMIVMVYPVSGQNHLKSQDLIGNWKLDGDIIVEFYQNGNLYNAKIVSSPDQKQEGIDMITNLMDNGKKYSGGSIYDPGNDKTYYCSVIIEGDKLKINGSIDKNGWLGTTIYAYRINTTSKSQTEYSQKKSKAVLHQIHVTKWYEDIDVISERYGVSVEKIMAINNLTERKLEIGQQLIIPFQEDIIHTVKSGDSYYKIAKRYGITAKELMEYNSVNSFNIRVGDRLRIPLKSDMLEEELQITQASINADNADEMTNASQSIPIIENKGVASDVDINIPTSGKLQESTFAVIIANENYKRESKVDYAINDGETFKQYCINTLGLPQSNVHCVKDATLNDFRAEMDWLSQISKAYQGEARLIVYYAGHGVPDEKTQSSYLLPIDGYGSNITTGYKLSDMYTSLSTYPAKSVMVFLDACFSGAQRDGDMLASARGVALKAKPEAPKGNMIVISAATGDETAYKYDEQSHGMFTYFLLKKLQANGADTTLGELADYITTNVSRKSIVVNMKSQTPTVFVSGTLSSDWRNLSFNE